MGRAPERLVVSAADAGARLDRFLAARLPDLSRARIQRLIRDGDVLVDGLAVRPSLRLATGNTITLARLDQCPAAVPVARPDLPLVVLHHDAALIVLDKPAGLVSHPAPGHHGDTLVNALLARFPDLATAFPGERPGLVHRLDRETSGVMVVARRPEAAEELRRQFGARTVEKVYLALAKGRVTPPEGLIDAPLGRDPRRRQRMAAIPQGRAARTGYRVLAEAGDYAWLEVRPQTGRTHQVRVHLAAIGHPVAGDRVYGRRDPRIGRTALHAWRLSFDHPELGRRVTFTAPLPPDLRTALGELGIRFEG